MSFLNKKIIGVKRKYEEADLDYEKLERDISRLIDDVRNDPNFPENGKEFLYEFLDDSGDDGLTLISKLKESYTLTKDGIIKAWNLKKKDGMSRLEVKTIDAREFISGESSLNSFKTICSNLQKIIDKYNIKIDNKKYENFK